MTAKQLFEYKPVGQPASSQTLSPNEHVQAIVELLRPLGADLARRWLAALALVPSHEREALVVEIERRIVEVYSDDQAPRLNIIDEISSAKATATAGSPKKDPSHKASPGEGD